MPFDVENHSPFPHFAFVKLGPDGSRFHVLVTRATYDWMHGDDMAIAAEQKGIVMAPERAGEPSEPELRFDTDLVVGKPCADVHVIGTARAPSSQPAADWIAGISIGTLSKALRVTGRRSWERSLWGWKLTEPVPCERVPLGYRQAFGGTRKGRDARDQERADVFERNPIGVGYVGRSAVEESYFAAPSIEAVNAPITTFGQTYEPEGFGPIERWWSPRKERCGSLTKEFVRDHPGRLPEDFDWHFYNSAPPSLSYQGFLRGDETLRATGLLQERTSSARLPGYMAVAVALFANGMAQTLAPKLDTLTLDTDARKVHVAWRLTIPEALRVKTLVLGFSVPPHARAAPSGLVPLRRRPQHGR